MCLAVPGLVKEVSGRTARVDFGGIEREIALDLLPETLPGEYIIAHAGFALQRLDVQEAEEVLELFRMMESAADDTDVSDI